MDKRHNMSLGIRYPWTTPTSFTVKYTYSSRSSSARNKTAPSLLRIAVAFSKYC